MCYSPIAKERRVAGGGGWSKGRKPRGLGDESEQAFTRLWANHILTATTDELSKMQTSKRAGWRQVNVSPST